MVLFADSAFRHGYREEDFFEVLESRPVKLRSRRGAPEVYELLGRNHAGDYLHLAYRRQEADEVVFHMRRMNHAERLLYRRHR